jgi:DNA polymerase-3 subunit epsilon
MILFFDTETTGKMDFKSHFTAEHQPHLCQLAAKVMTLDERVVASMNVMVKPEGWTISDEVAKVHGISHQDAVRWGLPRRTVLAMFSQLCKLAQHAVAYNIEFDSNLLWAQFHRENVKPESFNALVQTCAMKAAVPVCKIPSKFKRANDPYKWPNLTEAHSMMLGYGFDGAHDAMVDVDALARVTFHMIKTGNLQLAIL